jgi:hypothetical protein
MVPLLLLLTAAGVWSYRKRTWKVKEEPWQVQEEQSGGECAKKIDDEICEAEYCEMRDMDNEENLYTNAPGENNAVNEKMKLAELENDYTCVV